MAADSPSIVCVQTDPFKKLIRWGLCAWGLCQPVSIAGANIATGVILAGLLGHWAGSRSFPSLRSPLEKPLWIYLAVAVLVSLLAVDPRESFRHINSEAHKVALFYLFLAAFAIDAAPAALLWWAIGSVVAAIIGLLQVIFWHFFWHAFGPFKQDIGPYQQHQWCDVPHFWEWLWFTNRAHGTVNGVTYGEIMGLALVGGVCFAVVLRRQGVKVGRGPIIFCVLAGLAWFLSVTRGAWAGAIVSLGLVRALLAPRRAILEVLGASLIALPLMLAAGYLRNPEAGALDLTSFSCRFDFWEAALRMFRDHPFFGVGIHNYGSMFGQYHSLPLPGGISWGDPHNLYMAQLAERGSVGLLALLFLLGTMIRQAWLRYRGSGSFLSLWCLAWLVGFLVMNLTESAFQVAMLWMPTMILYAWMEKAPETLPPA